jgi:hypothetical protein
MTRSFLLIVFLTVAAFAADAPTKPASYFNDFEKISPGSKAPEDMLVLDGDFSVKAEGTNHYLEVSPDPLSSFGVLYGPALVSCDVSAKICATSTGRRFPEIGVGCGDAGGYKLMLVPGQSSLELRRADQPVARADYDKWQSGQWFSFRLKFGPAGEGKWRLQGKVWPASGKEPDAWLISYDSTEAPIAGRASVWASPFSGTPVRFDDLSAAGEAAGKAGN